MSNLTEKIILALKNFCPDNSNINSETKIIEDLGLESIDFVDFIFELEKLTGNHIDMVKLSVSLSQGTNKRFREVKVKDLAAYLETLKD